MDWISVEESKPVIGNLTVDRCGNIRLTRSLFTASSDTKPLYFDTNFLSLVLKSDFETDEAIFDICRKRNIDFSEYSNIAITHWFPIPKTPYEI